MPTIVNPPLTSVDYPRAGWHDITTVTPPGPVTARFSGGSQDGQVRVLPQVQPVLEFAVAPTQWYFGPEMAAMPQEITWQTERYYATQRTIEWNPTTATNCTIQIDYQVADAGTGNITLGNRWYGTANTIGPITLQSSWPQAIPLTPEQEAARARKYAREDRRKVLAHKRARRLLLNLLSEEQQYEYAQSKAFTVVAKNDKIFRLRKGKTAELLGSDGAAVAAYCIHLPGGYAPEDTLIALLLSLQTDPAEFERVANVTPLRPSPREAIMVAVEEELAAMTEARQIDRFRQEHIRESRAILRSEGLSEAEVEALREPPNHRDGLLVVGQAA